MLIDCSGCGLSVFINCLLTGEMQVHFNAHISSGREDPPLFFLYMVSTIIIIIIIFLLLLLLLLLLLQIAVANNCKSCIEFSDQLKVNNNNCMSYDWLLIIVTIGTILE